MGFIIQKIISIAALNQLKSFSKYLKSGNYNLPLILVESIISHPNKTSAFYALKVYGNQKPESLVNLNQLANYTFKLSAFFSQHYPNYILNIVPLIDVLLFENKKEEALELIKNGIDVAKKIEDYQSLLIMFNYIEMHFYGFEKTLPKNYFNDTFTHFENINTITQRQDELVRNTEQESIKKRIEKELTFFKPFFKSKSKSVQIIAKQSYLHLLSHFNHKGFYSTETLTLIKSTLKDIESHPYLSISKYKEKMMSLDYMYLKHTRLVLDEKAINSACSKIISKWRINYLNETSLDTGLFLALSIQGSYLITNYFFNKINTNLKQNIEETIDLCESLIHKIDWDKEGHLKHINFYNVYAIFLILSNQENKAIKLIETTLHHYQQKSFKKLYDGLFVILIMAYIKAEDFDKVIDSYNRYKKLTKDEISIVENDLIIKALYYIAQLKIQAKNQYQQKLDNVITDLKSDPKLNNNLLLIERTINSLFA
ncbi:MAG: hypothetical protein AB7O47_04500 [Flavobacteriales bacterium]